MAQVNGKKANSSDTAMPKDYLKEPNIDNYKMVPPTPQEITAERIKELLPRNAGHAVTNELVKLILEMENDTGLPQNLMEEEVYSYMHVISKFKKVKLEDYVHAVKFCNLKRNYTQEKAWSIVFPERYARVKTDGGQVDVHASLYNKTKMVQEIDKEMMIPLYLQYSKVTHSAVRKLNDLMHGRAINKDGEQVNVSPMVQMLSAKNLLDSLAMPEEAKIDITVSKSDEELDVQRQMNDQLAQLVQQQKARLDSGESLESVQKININFTDAEVV